MQPELRTPPAQPTTHVRPRTDPRALARSCTFDFNCQSTSNGQLTHSCDLASQPRLGLLRTLRPVPAPSADSGPARHHPKAAVRAAPGRFPRSPRFDRRGRRPALPLAASPRVRRRPSSRPHHTDRIRSASESPPANNTSGVRCAPAHIHQVRAGVTLKGVQPLVHFRYAFPSRSTSTGPSGGTGPPRLHRGCSRPHPRFRAQTAPSFSRAAATARRRSPFISARSVAPRGAQCRGDPHVALLRRQLTI